MRRQISILMAGSALSLSGYAIPAAAAETAAADKPAAAQDDGVDRGSDEAIFENRRDIIVYARREAELISDVPQTVEAIAGEELSRLSLYQFDDISKLLSGVQLSRAGNVATIRGVSFNPVAGTTSSASYYLNEAPLQGAFIFQSIFDVGQIEVLKGPQGTQRGQSAPSGAISVYSRRPDLAEFGGYAQATVTDDRGRTIQGAINVPLVQDMLALRIAGITDHTNGGGIRSVNSTADPFSETNAMRVSLRAQPVDGLDATFMFQRLRTDSLGFGSAVYGNGAPGNGIVGTAAQGYNGRFVQTPGFNGPVIPLGSRLSVAEYGDRSKGTQDLATAQIDYGFSGFKLSYVGGYSRIKPSAATTFGDNVGNLIIGDFPGRSNAARLKRYTHELRLETEERLFGVVDAVIGVFDLSERGGNSGNNGLTFQNGAFGTVLAAPLNVSPNVRFSTTNFFESESKTDERSFFMNARIHITDNTELSGGVRFIKYTKNGIRVNSASSGFRAVGFVNAAGSPVNPITSAGTPTPGRVAITSAQCTTLGGSFGATYAGVCDVPVAANVSPAIVDDFKETPAVYSATLSHHFTPDVMVYANYGTSFRPGPTQGALVNGTNDPLLASYQQLASEKSTSYEAGVKASLFNHVLNLNLAGYHQKYKNLVFSDFSAIPYLNDNGQGIRQVTLQIPLNYNVDAEVNGFDFDMSVRPTDRLNFGGSVSYADGKFKNQLIPCTDADFDGIPSSQDPGDAGLGALLLPPLPQFGIPGGVALFQNAGVYIAQCKADGRASATPKWSATLRADYSHPISGSVEGYGAAYYSWQSKNPYGNPAYTVPSYGLLNLNIGIRDNDAGWELQAFAKNLTNRKVITSKSVSGDPPVAIDAVGTSGTLGGLFGNSGYTSVGYTLPREFGLTFRYAFGSH